MKKSKNTPDNFIERAKEVHPEYCYDKTIFVDPYTKVEVQCKHGSFFITPGNLIYGYGCTLCGRERTVAAKKLNQEIFLDRVIPLHPYCDFSNAIYITVFDKVKVLCTKHNNNFEITPSHLFQSKGCYYCGLEKISNKLSSNTEEFIKKAIKIAPQYDYSKVDYKNNHTNVIINCIPHGDFVMTPNSFLDGGRICPECTKENVIKERELYYGNKFIEEAKIIFPEYIFDKTIYKKSMELVIIECIDHGLFEAYPKRILNGYGCKYCRRNFGELFTTIVFEIIFKTKFIKIRPDWLMRVANNRRTNLELDGYAFIEYLNYAIAFEYQGRHHEEIVLDFHMTEEDLIKRKLYDQIKRDKCKEQNVKLIEIPQFNKNFKPKDLKDFIGCKCIELGINLPKDFDQILINIDQIKKNINMR